MIIYLSLPGHSKLTEPLDYIPMNYYSFGFSFYYSNHNFRFVLPWIIWISSVEIHTFLPLNPLYLYIYPVCMGAFTINSSFSTPTSQFILSSGMAYSDFNLIVFMCTNSPYVDI